MSKASQRKLAEQQKRNEKFLKANPALAKLKAISEEDVFLNPPLYWSTVLTLGKTDPPHIGHEQLERFFTKTKPFFESLHDSTPRSGAFHGQQYIADNTIPGIVLTVNERGIEYIRPKSPFFHPPEMNESWHVHLLDLYGPERQKGGVECCWYWTFSIPVPGNPLFVLGVGQSGAAHAWCRVGSKWIAASGIDVARFAFRSLTDTDFTHPHRIALSALKRGLESGTIGAGSAKCDIAGTANAVSTLVTEFAQPYVVQAERLARQLLARDVLEEVVEQELEDALVRGKVETKVEVQRLQRLLVAERQVSQSLRRELAAKSVITTKPSGESPQSNERITAKGLNLAHRMGIFFGQ